jgi:hypothetical protein
MPYAAASGRLQASQQEGHDCVLCALWTGCPVRTFDDGPRRSSLLEPRMFQLRCGSIRKAILRPKNSFGSAWNRGLGARATPIARGLIFGRCRSKRDHVVLTVLQVLAKQEDHRFKFGDLSEFHSVLCLDSSRRSYIAFSSGRRTEQQFCGRSLSLKGGGVKDMHLPWSRIG